MNATVTLALQRRPDRPGLR